MSRTPAKKKPAGKSGPGNLAVAASKEHADKGVVHLSFRLDEEASEILNDLSVHFSAGNKTLLLKAALYALKARPDKEQQIKNKVPAQAFRLDSETAGLLAELSDQVASGNKTLTVRYALNTLAAMSEEDQRKMVIRLLQSEQ